MNDSIGDRSLCWLKTTWRCFRFVMGNTASSSPHGLSDILRHPFLADESSMIFLGFSSRMMRMTEDLQPAQPAIHGTNQLNIKKKVGRSLRFTAWKMAHWNREVSKFNLVNFIHVPMFHWVEEPRAMFGGSCCCHRLDPAQHILLWCVTRNLLSSFQNRQNCQVISVCSKRYGEPKRLRSNLRDVLWR